MKNYLFLVTFVVFFFFSCNNQERIETLIAGKEYKYWIIEPNVMDDDMIFKYYDRTGKIITFYKGPNGSFGVLYTDDVLLSTEWKLINDSVLRFGPVSEWQLINGNIQRFSPDYGNASILTLTDKAFVYKYGDHITTLIAAPDSLIPPEFRKIQKYSVTESGEIIK